ncbi:MAG: hypothetical protein ABFD54_10765 [Armatimonadota bacterium]|nr:hypothetical protein [bacterium]
MPRPEGSVEKVREISVDPQPGGLRAVYLVETRSDDEAHEIDNLFAELQSQVQVLQLCEGKLVSYAVQAHESDAAVLDEIESFLKENFAFVVTQRSFDDLIYRIVTELSGNTGSKLHAVSRCNICGKVEPFPTTLVNMTREDGSVFLSRCYCASCTAEAAAPSNKEFIRSLLAADQRDFKKIARAELVRCPSRKQPMRFKVKDLS